MINLIKVNYAHTSKTQTHIEKPTASKKSYPYNTGIE